MKDRPASASIINGDGNLISVNVNAEPWLNISKMFVSEDSENHTVWDNSELSKTGPEGLQYLAEHSLRTDTQPARILVRAEKMDHHGNLVPTTFEDIWTAVIFELLNIENGEEFTKVYKDVLFKKMEKKEWVYRNTVLEYKALRKLRKFYTEHWKPWAEKNKIETDPHNWGVSEDIKYKDWFKGVRKNNMYRYWDDYYDESLVPYWNSKPELQKSDKNK